MKLSYLTPEQKTRLLAELDVPLWTWEITGSDDTVWIVEGNRSGCVHRIAKPYPTSYDAIIPLVQKLFTKETCHCFFDALGLIAIVDWNDGPGSPQSYEGDGSYFEQWVLFKATPSQLCDAVLVATGKCEL